jgi:hypothetical protein
MQEIVKDNGEVPELKLMAKYDLSAAGFSMFQNC